MKYSVNIDVNKETVIIDYRGREETIADIIFRFQKELGVKKGLEAALNIIRINIGAGIARIKEDSNSEYEVY